MHHNSATYMIAQASRARQGLFMKKRLKKRKEQTGISYALPLFSSLLVKNSLSTDTAQAPHMEQGSVLHPRLFHN